jgi:hypothetical protein
MAMRSTTSVMGEDVIGEDVRRNGHFAMLAEAENGWLTVAQLVVPALRLAWLFAYARIGAGAGDLGAVRLLPNQ